MWSPFWWGCWQAAAHSSCRGSRGKVHSRGMRTAVGKSAEGAATATPSGGVFSRAAWQWGFRTVLCCEGSGGSQAISVLKVSILPLINVHLLQSTDLYCLQLATLMLFFCTHLANLKVTFNLKMQNEYSVEAIPWYMVTVYDVHLLCIVTSFFPYSNA